MCFFKYYPLPFIIISGGRKGKIKVLFINMTALHIQSISFFSCNSSFTKQHYGSILVQQFGREKTADTVCSLPMTLEMTCFPIKEAEQKIKLKWQQTGEHSTRNTTCIQCLYQRYVSSDKLTMLLYIICSIICFLIFLHLCMFLIFCSFSF